MIEEQKVIEANSETSEVVTEIIYTHAYYLTLKKKSTIHDMSEIRRPRLNWTQNGEQGAPKQVNKVESNPRTDDRLSFTTPACLHLRAKKKKRVKKKSEKKE